MCSPHSPCDPMAPHYRMLEATTYTGEPEPEYFLEPEYFPDQFPPSLRLSSTQRTDMVGPLLVELVLPTITDMDIEMTPVLIRRRAIAEEWGGGLGPNTYNRGVQQGVQQGVLRTPHAHA